MNDKKERVSSGENYMDYKAISNYQQKMLNQLNRFGREFKRHYPQFELMFDVTEYSQDPVPMNQQGFKDKTSHPSSDES